MRKSTLIKAAAGVLTLAAAWFFLAPPQLGGSSSYVITYGTSMQPAYHSGDLAIVRASSSYHVGEIVAYRNMALGGHTVLHRIIAIHEGRYTFKGDHNTFIDSFHPDRSELVGRLWVHVPTVGKYLVLARGPRAFFLAGLFVLLAIGCAALARHPRVRGPGVASPPVQPTHGPFPVAPAVALGVLLACGALCAASYSRPLTRTGVEAGAYTQSGRFSYEAKLADKSPVYRGETVSTGQPLFLSVVGAANVRFAYRFESRKTHRVFGRASLSATLAAPDGWHRKLVLAGPQQFSGDNTTVAGSLDLAKLKALANEVATLSNVSGQTYTLTLTPHVELGGAVDGRPIHETFSPSLPFLLDANQLQLQPGSAGGPSSATLLRQSTSGSGPVVVANTLSLAKIRLGVSTARRLALYGAAGSLVALVAGLLFWYHRRPRSEADAIDRRFGHVIVEVTETPRGLELPTVAVGSIEGLVQIAEQAARMILHLRHEASDVFFVEDNGFVYVYEARTPAAAVEPQSAPAPAAG